MRTLRVLLLSLALLAAAPAAFTPYLVKDINPEYTPAGSDPEDFTALGDLVLFQIDKSGNSELWRSDGTASGTYPLTESRYMEVRAVAGGLCFFDSLTPGGSQLWVTDGTLPGTFALAEATTSSYRPWVALHGVLYFAAEVPGQEHGVELWRSDGTPGGTYEVLDIEPGPGSSYPAYLTSFQGRLYFTASGSLWKSDGTAQGTVLVRDVPAGSLYVVGSRLLFIGRDAGHGHELWASDGTTEGTHRISDLAKGEDSPDFRDFVASGKLLYFAASVGPGSSFDLYATDGADQGTRKLTSFSNSWRFSYAAPLAVPGDRLLFAADDGTHGMELWTSDGTPEGTRLVLDACPGSCESNPGGLTLHEGRIYYQATDGMHGSELWVTDGTAQGTRMVKDICPGACGNWMSTFSSPHRRLLLTTREMTGGILGPATLWATDGTEEGTVRLGAAGSLAGTAAGGTLFFAGTDPDHGCEVWISDGTAQGTHLVADIADEDVGGSKPGALMRLGQSVLFSARDGEGAGLWRSDGTEEGTTLVKRGLPLEPWAASANRVYFRLFNPERTSAELWTSDGTETGTLRLTPEGVDASASWSAALVGSRLFFSARTAKHGVEPWVTDGTRAGTRLVADLKPGPDSSWAGCYTAFRGKVWFGALSRLWKSDGRSAAVQEVFKYKRPGVCPFTTFGGRLLYMVSYKVRTDVLSTDGVRSSYLDASRGFDPTYVVHRGRLWFTSKDVLWSTDGRSSETAVILPGEEGPDQMMSDGARLYLCLTQWWDDVTGLWVTDGTEDGTQKISDLERCGPWKALGGRLYFAAGDDGTLYRSNGTSAGTRPVRPDGEPDQVSLLVPFGDRLLVFAGDGEVWQTDGTADGTKPIGPPETLFNGGSAVKAGPRLFLPGWDPESGWELWAIQE